MRDCQQFHGMGIPYNSVLTVRSLFSLLVRRDG